MSFRDKFRTFASNMSVAELADAIREDARDTQDKIAPLCGLFLEIISANEDDDLTDYLSELYAEHGGDLTVMLQDGDVCRFRIIPNGDSYDLKYVAGHYENSIITRGHVSITDADREFIETMAGTYKWSTGQIAESLASQMQSSVVVEKLASLATGATVTVSDINSALSEVSSKLSGPAYNFVQRIKGLGGRLNPSSLVNGLRSMVLSMNSYTSESDSIDFDDTDWSLKTFNGSVLWQVVQTAGQFVAVTLFAAGGIIAKIIGGGLYVATSIIPGIVQAAGVTEEATFDPAADQYEYATPIIQGTFSVNDVDADFLEYVKQNRLVKITSPIGHIYAWINDVTNGPVNYALYLDLTMYCSYRSTRSVSALSDQAVIERWDDTTSSPGNKIVHLDLAIDGNYVDENHRVFPFNDYIGFFNDAPGGDFSFIDDANDFNLRYRVLLAIYPIVIRMYMESLVQAGTIQRFTLNGVPFIPGASYGTGVTEAAMASSFMDDFKDPEADGKLSSLLAACFFSTYGGYAPSWGDINNYVIPFIANWSFMPAVIQRYMLAPSFTDGLVSCRGAVMGGVRFRGSYLVTPPNYTKGSALAAVLTALIAVAAIAATVAVTKFAITRKVTDFMTDKYAAIQTKYDRLKQSYGTDQYESVRKDYLKSVRKYNLLARLTGFSTLSSVQGWETGSSSELKTTSGFTDNPTIQTLIDSFSGSDTADGKIYSIKDILLLIAGNVD